MLAWKITWVKRLKWAKKGNSMWIDPYGAKTTKGVFEGLRKNGIFSALSSAGLTSNKTPKVVSVGCVGPWKHNGVLSEFGKIRETGKMCHVMSIDE